MKIGFIGLGNMGLPMAKNLKDAGHEVLGFDVVPSALEAAKQAGLEAASSNQQAAQNADCVVTMLPNGQISKLVATEVIQTLNAGALLIDCSTIDVESANDIHSLANEANVLALDAPVSGGVGGAAAGTLTFMIGGEDVALLKGQPLFEIMGAKSVHCGDGGKGQVAKMCNNMLLAITMAGASEAFNLGEKLGINPQNLFDVMSTSSGSCWSINTYCPVPGIGPKSPADNDYQPGFAVDLMLKDAGLSQDAAKTVGAQTPLGAHATQLYAAMAEQGLGGQDFSAIIDFLKQDKPKA
ncbi:MAG: 3-hydroxyisobutyrate dehydrogenase [Nitratireductor sp.]